jgi:hypothetical protein
VASFFHVLELLAIEIQTGPVLQSVQKMLMNLYVPLEKRDFDNLW